MDDAKQQLIDKLKSSNNILVTVSRDPSVDQLASCIGLTLLLNKQGKHAAAVFSGKVPSTLEFLQPDETLEKNTDSLRDFIISLDKTKADKLRYKVEEDVVRIFITPYKTSLSEDDLEFSEGDFNVDVVVALGVQKQEDLDQAITAHGRILHDATVTSINAAAEGGLGTINWNDPQASSLSELVTDLAQALETELDAQIATALMTGIVSETGRFSNDKTSSQTMSASAALMVAGANQQLVASQLETENTTATIASDEGQKVSSDGLLAIDHAHDPEEAPTEPIAVSSVPEPEAPEPETPAPELPAAPEPSEVPGEPDSSLSEGSKLVTEPPTMGGTLTANSQSEQLDPVTDPFSMPTSEPPQLLDRKDSKPADSPAPPSVPTLQAAPSDWNPPAAPPIDTPIDKKAHDNDTLTDIEKSVNSPHADQDELDSVRNEVNEALSASESTDPIEALNAQPFGGDLHPADAPQAPAPDVPIPPLPAADSAVPPAPIPATPTIPPAAPAPADDSKDDSNTPPPVPPPIPFQFGNSPPSQ